MTVTQADIDQVPVGNLRVPRAEFAAVWTEAERRARTPGTLDWYAGGVQVTCMWLAGAVTRTPAGRPELARSPVTERAVSAYEELIEAEYLAAESLPSRRPALVERRPGWCEGIRLTLRWAWRHQGPPPYELADIREDASQL